MKNIQKFTILLSMLLMISVMTYAEDNKQAATSEVKIKTSAVCEMCKERLEDAMSLVNGVTKSELNVNTKILTVSYDPIVVTVDDIKKAVTKTGYDADEIPAIKKAYNKLPGCCKKTGHAK